ncbi:MAG: type II CAAX endopeptidase family protein [Candidatus Micrarchaeaceae archaeon]
MGSKKEHASIRYLSYFISVFIIILIFYYGSLYANNKISKIAFESNGSIAFSLFFPSIVFSYLLWKGLNLKQIIETLNLSKDKFTFKIIIAGIALFLGILALELGFAAFSSITNIQLPTNVSSVLTGTPIYFLAFTFLIAPIDEEIFFRGFLINGFSNFFKSFSKKKVTNNALALWSGVIASAIIFSILHLSYLSISEFLAAFIFGLLAGYVFVKTKSLYPSIMAHMLVNFLAIISFISVGMLIPLIHL